MALNLSGKDTASAWSPAHASLHASGEQEAAVIDAQSALVRASPRSVDLLDGASTVLPGSHTGSWRDAIFHDWRELKLAPADVRADRKVVLQAVSQNLRSLEFATIDLRSDKAFVIDCVRTHGQALQYASEELRADWDVVSEAIGQDRRALRFAADELRSDGVGLVAEGVRLGGHTLHCAAGELGVPIEAARRGVHVVAPTRWREKVLRDTGQLAVAPPEAKADKDLVAEAVRISFGEALQHACDSLRSDQDIVLQAVRLDGRTLRHATQGERGPRGNRMIVMEAVRQTWEALQYATESLRGDKEIAVAAMVQSTDALAHVSESLSGERAFMKRAVQCDGLAIRFCSVELLRDHDLIFTAARQNVLALKYVHESDREVVGNRLMDIDTRCPKTTKWLDIQTPLALDIAP